MNKNLRKISALLALCMALCLFAACGGVKDDVPVADIVTAVDSAVGAENLVPVEENYVRGRLKLDVSGCEEYTVKINSMGTNVDEYGLFKAKDEDAAKALAEDVQSYLDERLSTWMDEYMPEEKPKVENAAVKTQGVYVMYTILSDKGAAAAFNALDEAVK